ncbi:MAG: 3-isopropylmalate dehydratase small subunit [Methanobacteriota archaeon]|nr:MAG: 3-isopropylmalate dehydratase small subunit [Euryarchaeota archaeon]
METTFSGKVWKFGDNINTDDITPSPYLTIQSPEELAKHVLENENPDFPKNVQKGDILVAGKNFGCGSSREHAPVALKAAGVALIVAKSFARIFFRNAINVGISVLESDELLDAVEEGEMIKVNLEKGEIETSSGNIIKTNPLPENVLGILEAGGLVEKVKMILGERG